MRVIEVMVIVRVGSDWGHVRVIRVMTKGIIRRRGEVEVRVIRVIRIIRVIKAIRAIRKGVQER